MIFNAFGASVGAILGPLGANLWPSCGYLGPTWGHLGASWGQSWGPFLHEPLQRLPPPQMNHSPPPNEPPHFGPSWDLLWPLGAIFRRLGAILGLPRFFFGKIKQVCIRTTKIQVFPMVFNAFGASVGAILGSLGANLGTSLEPS